MADSKKVITISAIDNYSNTLNAIQNTTSRVSNKMVEDSSKRLSQIQKEMASNGIAPKEQIQQISQITDQRLFQSQEENNRKRAQMMADLATKQKQIDDQKAARDQVRIKKDNEAKSIADKKLLAMDVNTDQQAVEITKKYAKLKADASSGFDKSKTEKQVKKLSGQEDKEFKDLAAKTKAQEKTIADEQLKAVKLNQSNYQKEIKTTLDKEKVLKTQTNKDISKLDSDNLKKEKELLKDKETATAQSRKQMKDEADKEKKQNRNYRAAGETGINASITGIGQALSTGNVYGAVVNTAGGIGSAIAGLIPGIGGILGTAVSAVTQIATAALSAAKRDSRAELNLRRITGSGSVSNVGIENMNTTEIKEAIIQTSKQRMKGGEKDIQEQILFEQRRGYGTNELFGGLNRYANVMGGGTDKAQVLTDRFLKVASSSKLWNLDPNKKQSEQDYSMIGSAINQGLLPMIQREFETSDTVTGTRATNVVSKFASLGGGFGDPAMGAQRVAAIDQAIRKPSNPWVDNLVKSAIIKNNPGADLNKVRDLQEQGILNMDTFGTVLKEIKTSLDPTMQHTALMNMIPSLVGNPHARELILNQSELLTSGRSEEEIKRELEATGKYSSQDIGDALKGVQTATSQEQWENKIYNELVYIGKLIVEGINRALPTIIGLLTWLAHPVKETKKWMDEIMGKDLSDMTAEMVSRAVNPVGNAYEDFKKLQKSDISSKVDKLMEAPDLKQVFGKDNPDIIAKNIESYYNPNKPFSKEEQYNSEVLKEWNTAGDFLKKFKEENQVTYATDKIKTKPEDYGFDKDILKNMLPEVLAEFLARINKDSKGKNDRSMMEFAAVIQQLIIAKNQETNKTDKSSKNGK